MTQSPTNYMAQALDLKAQSRNRFRQVGAVITNGVGAHNTFLTEREGPMTTQHAEAHAICRSAAEGIPTKGHEIYVTLSPCVDCAKLIIQAGISTVYFHEYDPDQPAGIQLLQHAGVKVYGTAHPQDDLPR